MDILANAVAFGIGMAVAVYTTYKAREPVDSSYAALKEHQANVEHDRNVDHVPYRAYVYAFFLLLLFADCAAGDLGGHYERSGRDGSEFVQDWQPTYAQRWREHERIREGRFVPLGLGVLAFDLGVRYSARRRKRKAAAVTS